MRIVISLPNKQNQGRKRSVCQETVSVKTDRLEAPMIKGFQSRYFRRFLKAFIHQCVSDKTDRLKKLTDWKLLLPGLSAFF